MKHKILTATLSIILFAAPSYYTPVPPKVNDVVTQDVSITVESESVDTSPTRLVEETETSAEWLIDVPLDAALQEHIYNRCIEYDIAEHYELVYAVIRTESNYTPDIVSRTNDYGLMQINKCNHEWLGSKLGIVDFLDPYQNVDAGIYLLQYLIHKYESPEMALMCYNLGEGGAAKRWHDGIYSTTYTDKVLDYYNQIIENI